MSKQLHGITVIYNLKDKRRANWIIAYTKSEAITLLIDFLIYQKNYAYEDINVLETHFHKGNYAWKITEEWYNKQKEIVYKGVTR